MISEKELREQICDVGKRIYDRGMVAANDGNISVRISNNEFLCTPTGVSKGFMKPEMLCRIDCDGKMLEDAGDYRPSSEIKMHLRVYADREDVQAVVHAHPLYATSFAVAGIPLNKPIMPEAIVSLGEVPIVPYGRPSTAAIPESIAPFLQSYDALLLANHGALTFSDSLLAAYHKMESVEFYAQIMFITRQIGSANEIPREEIRELLGLRQVYGMSGKHPGEAILREK